MGTKKITDLQLIDAATADISIPGDNGIQTYRLTVQQLFDFILGTETVTLPALDAAIFNGLSAVTPADDDYFPLVDTSDSNKTKKGIVGSFKNAVYRSVTSTDSVGLSDETMKLSGSSFTSTLPTAVGVTGKRYKYIHSGTSLTNVYTLATTSGQTIGGVASGSYKLVTANEVLEIESDGANWIIINHYAKTPWASAGVNVFTGTTSNPTKGTSSIDKVIWSRDGDTMNVKFSYRQTGAGSDGSGSYLMGIPAGVSADTTVMTASTAGTDYAGAIGSGMFGSPGANGGVHEVMLYDATHVWITGTLNNAPSVFGFWASNYLQMSVSPLGVTGQYSIVVAGWQP